MLTLLLLVTVLLLLMYAPGIRYSFVILGKKLKQSRRELLKLRDLANSDSHVVEGDRDLHVRGELEFDSSRTICRSV